MAEITVKLGNVVHRTGAETGSILAAAVNSTGLHLEQQCAGKGTCGKCKALVQGDLAPPDDVEQKRLSADELRAGYRLVCRARVSGNSEVVLSPPMIHSAKIFGSGRLAADGTDPLGIAVDLGSTTVAAFLTSLETGDVYAGSAVLNQQTNFGADIISRLEAAETQQVRLSSLAIASIREAIRGLHLSRSTLARVQRAVIVGNTAMHHLLLKLPIDQLRFAPFHPATLDARVLGSDEMDSLFPQQVEILMPPLIGGFAGSDALACLLHFGFDVASEPMLAADLGTNGEVMVTDTKRIVVATAPAGPAFEGVNISCGSRAVPGAIVSADVRGTGEIEVKTIGDEPPIGVTGSGLLSIVNGLHRHGVVSDSGRIIAGHKTFGGRIWDEGDERCIAIVDGITLTQGDIRQLQMAKAAILSASEAILDRVGLRPQDLSKVILTGSFGSQIGVSDVLDLKVIPSVSPDVVESFANGAGLGAAKFFDDDLRRRGEAIASIAEHVELFADSEFMDKFVQAMPF